MEVHQSEKVPELMKANAAISTSTGVWWILDVATGQHVGWREEVVKERSLEDVSQIPDL
jgi:hypothetical protein